MKKVLATLAGLLCAATLVAHAQDAKPAKKKLSAEQKALKKEMLEKYDTDKNGKLDKSERAKISKEDRKKMIKAGLIKSKKHAASSETSADAPAGK